MNNEMLAQYTHMRNYFNEGNTLSYAFRKQQLQLLKNALLQYEEAIYEALYTDLKKSKEECWVTEIGLVITEINYAIKHLKSWMRPTTANTNLLNLPSKSYVQNEPIGIAFIIAPWNYPVQLLLNPLIGAITAGNCVVLKPSEFAPASAAVLKNIITSVFSPNYILFVEGDGAVVVPQFMQAFNFDYVFYTGSTAIGKKIYQMAAEKLIPVTLELGGKSPCVVEADASISVAAKRIAVTKFSNCGQMCVAPDYVLVHHTQKDNLVNALRTTIQHFFQNNPLTHENYGKMINEKQFDRVVNYLSQGNILFGGKYDKSNLYIEPTLIENVSVTDAIMKDEIFGPVLPIISFTTMEEAKAIIAQNLNPLAFYIFSSSSKIQQNWLQAVPSGGACINNTSWHLTNHHLPFGGRGFSGTGAYHGKYSFQTFSHQKAVMKTPTWFDPSIKYPPFKGKLNLFKMAIK